MRNILAKSNNYTLNSEFEEAQLEGHQIDDHVVVGDFYGVAECGCIDWVKNGLFLPAMN